MYIYVIIGVIILIGVIVWVYNSNIVLGHNLDTPTNNDYAIFEKQNHFKSPISKTEFDSLKGADLAWEVLEPMSKMAAKLNIKNEKDGVKRLSNGQKALYFFWYLDGQVTNGGFIQFYWNGYSKYLPAIIEGLKLIQDTEMLNLVNEVEIEFKRDVNVFAKYMSEDNFSGIYKELKRYEKFDNRYYDINENTFARIEKYIREHKDDFVVFN